MIKAKKIYKKMVIGKLKRHNEIGTFDCTLTVFFFIKYSVVQKFETTKCNITFSETTKWSHFTWDSLNGLTLHETTKCNIETH